VIVIHIFLKKGDEYIVSGIEDNGDVYIKDEYYNYIGCYPLDYFFTLKQIRKMKIDNIMKYV
jgi:hypothetical protein